MPAFSQRKTANRRPCCGTYHNRSSLPTIQIGLIRVGNSFLFSRLQLRLLALVADPAFQDLVHWTIIGYVFKNIRPGFQSTTTRQRVGATFVHHRGEFMFTTAIRIAGLYVKGKNAAGPWSPLFKYAKQKAGSTPVLFGTIQNAYLVLRGPRAAGINSILTIHRMSADGRKILDEGQMVLTATPIIQLWRAQTLQARWLLLHPCAGGRCPDRLANHTALKKYFRAL